MLTTLLVALAGIFIIARINRNIRLFGTLMLLLALGFVGGATYSRIYSLEKNKTEKVTMVNMINGYSTSTVGTLSSFTWTPSQSLSSLLGKEYFISDKSCEITPRVVAVHPVRCLSPPFLEDSS